MVVPLCLIVIALAMQHLNGPRIIRSCWTRRCIQRRNTYGAYHALVEEFRNEDPFLNCVYTFAGFTGRLTFRKCGAAIGY